MWLRRLSPRPDLLVDPGGRFLDDPNQTQLGWDGPLGRGRMVAALPLNDGPRRLRPDRVIHDSSNAMLADPDGNVIGMPGLVVTRILDAMKVGDTRRL